MHDHGESGGTIQQMDKGDQTLAFAMRKSRPNHSTTHNRGVTKEDSDGVGTAAAASSLAAHRATPRLRPSPHLHQKEFGKPGALEEEEEALPLEKGDLSHASVPAYSISFLKKKRGGEEKNSYQFKNWRIASPTKPLGSCHLSTRKDQEQVHR